MNVPCDTLFQNCSAPLNRRVARAPDKKSFKRHLLLNHWSNFKIISQNCSSWYPLPKYCKHVFAPLNKMAAKAPDRKYLQKASTPEPLVQIQNNFTELFLIIPSTNIAQMTLLHWTKGLVSSRQEISLNTISSWTTCPNSKLFYRIVPLDTFFQKSRNGSAQLNKRATRAPD